MKSANYLGIWKIEEDESFFRNELQLDEHENEFLSTIKAENRRLQWLSTRLLIRRIINPKGQILMEWDDFGKPIIINYDFEVSISHSNEMVSVIVGDRKSGNDIERKDRKVERIARKFIRDDEFAFIEEEIATDYYITIWAAKETMFKFYGGGGIDFKEHMSVKPFKMEEKGEFEMEYLKGGNEMLTINYEWINGHILTHCI